MFGSKLTKIAVSPHEASPIFIAGDGAISTVGVGDGRLLPGLILDADTRPDIHEYIAMHQVSGAGDVRVQWCQVPPYKDTVMLLLSFQRPAELKAIIAFELERHQGFLVEQILQTKGVYLQAGRMGDRLKDTIDKPKVLVEIPDTGFRQTWDKLYFRFTEKKLRRAGLDRKRAQTGAREAIAMLREIGAFRMPQPKPSP